MLRALVLTAILCAPIVAHASPYYQNDFETAAGPEWSNTSLSVTPVGGRQFLGTLGSGTTSLTLNGIPDGQPVSISFDLFIINTWDGSQGIDPLSDPVHIVGPDVWSFSANGSPLLSTTFSVFDGTKEMHSFRNYPQAYPGSYPVDSFAARSGAVENDSLGYFEGDSVYHLAFNFVHSSGSLVLDFTGSFPAVDPEEWGIDNMVVTIPEPSAFVLASMGLALVTLSIAALRRPRGGSSHFSPRPSDDSARRRIRTVPD